MRAQRWGLGTRLLLATVAVVLVGAGTAWLVAASLGPRIFHEHMVAGQAADEPVVYHAEWAFRDASTLSLALALMAALLASVAMLRPGSDAGFVVCHRARVSSAG